MRELTLKRRYGGMTATEVMLARHYKDMSLALLIVFALEDERGQGHEGGEADDYLLLASLFLCRLQELERDRTTLPLSVRGEDVTIASLSETEAWTSFRFRKADLSRLLTALGMPDEWRCSNGSQFRGETGLLLLLYRLRLVW